MKKIAGFVKKMLFGINTEKEENTQQTSDFNQSISSGYKKEPELFRFAQKKTETETKTQILPNSPNSFEKKQNTKKENKEIQKKTQITKNKKNKAKKNKEKKNNKTKHEKPKHANRAFAKTLNQKTQKRHKTKAVHEKHKKITLLEQKAEKIATSHDISSQEISQREQNLSTKQVIRQPPKSELHEIENNLSQHESPAINLSEKKKHATKNS